MDSEAQVSGPAKKKTSNLSGRWAGPQKSRLLKSGAHIAGQKALSF
jgi:hypothetical protein